MTCSQRLAKYQHPWLLVIGLMVIGRSGRSDVLDEVVDRVSWNCTLKLLKSVHCRRMSVLRGSNIERFEIRYDYW